MTARILPFPQRGPFVVRIEREDSAWLVICRSHSWLHGEQREAIADAVEIANGFGAAIKMVCQ